MNSIKQYVVLIVLALYGISLQAQTFQWQEISINRLETGDVIASTSAEFGGQTFAMAVGSGTAIVANNDFTSWDNLDVPRDIYSDVELLSYEIDDGMLDLYAWIAGGDGQSDGKIYRSRVLGDTFDESFRNWTSQTTGLNEGISAIDFIDPLRGWAVGVNGSLISTTDGGDTWENDGISTGLNSASDIYFSDSDTGYVVGGTFDNNSNTAVVKKTVDGGNTWTTILENNNAGSFNKIIFTSNSVGYVFGYSGFIHKTEDSGLSWSSNSDIFNIYDDASFLNKEVGFANDYNGGMVYTLDGGESWNLEFQRRDVYDNFGSITTLGNEAVAFTYDSDNGLSIVYANSILPESPDILYPTYFERVEPRLIFAIADNGKDNSPLYEFEISDDPSFNEILIDWSDNKSTEGTYLFPNFNDFQLGEGEYYWRVREFDRGTKLHSDWSVGSFYLYMESPEIVFPQPGSIVELPIEISWVTSQISNAFLQIQISESPNFDRFVINEDFYPLELNSYSIPEARLRLGREYFFRIRKLAVSSSDSLVSEWSGTSFTTTTSYIRLLPDSVFTAQPNNVNIMLHAASENNEGIDFLTRDSFELLENGFPISPTETNYQLSKLEGIPFNLQTVLMLDNSLSIGESNLEFIKEAAKFFVRNKIPKMEVSVNVFADGREMIQDFTTDTAALLTAIDAINLTNIPGTDLYTAAIEGLQQWNDTYSLTDINQGFMLLFTDGRDLAGRNTLTDVLTLRGNKQVYTVGVELNPNDFDRNALELIGNAGTFIDSDFTNLTTRFEEVKEQLESFSNSFYWLNYSSASRSENSNLTVSVVENTNTGSDSEINTNFDASDFYSVPRDIIVNGSAENPVGVDSLFIPADSTVEVSIETVFSYDLTPYSFTISDDSKIDINPVSEKPFVFAFTANGFNGDEIEVDIADTAQKTLDLQKSIVVVLTNPTGVNNEEEADGLPVEFTLQQNYPNPFNPSSTIRFGVPEASEVRLEVYNMLGQRVATLVDSRMAAGWHTVTFDAAGLSTGTYIYQIRAGNFLQTRKMLLIK